MNKMDSYLENLAVATTQEKDVLAQLVNNNTNLLTKLTELIKKFEQLSSQDNSSKSSSAPMFNGKKMKFVKHNKDTCCYTHGYRCLQKKLAGFFLDLELTIRNMQLEKTLNNVQLTTRSGPLLITKRRDFGSHMNNTIDS